MTDKATSIAEYVRSFRFKKDPIRNGLDRLVVTGRLPGAPVAHQRVADFVEYATAIINSTTTVAEGITAQDLTYFAWGLPVFSTSDNNQVDAKDIENLVQFSKLQPTSDAIVGHYHVNATYHTSKLLLIAASNPRAIEWLYMIAIMVQRGLRKPVIEMLLRRKDDFLSGMQQDLPDGSISSTQALMAYSANLRRLIVNVVGSLESLDLGELGGHMSLEGDLPAFLDFDHYITPYESIFDIVKFAEGLGCQFHETPLYVEPDSQTTRSVERPARSLTLTTSRRGMLREKRIDSLRAMAGTIRYQIIDGIPTGRVNHDRLVSGILHYAKSKFTAVQFDALLRVLRQPSVIRIGLAVDLRSGIADLNPGDGRAVFECAGINEGDLPVPADIRHLEIFINNDQNIRNMDFLAFQDVLSTSHANGDLVKQVLLVVKGSLWAKSLIRDLPEKIYVPSPTMFFHVLALIGSTMMHLEQGSGVDITSNNIFYALSLLTNSGGDSDPEATECMIYAAQGPAGTLVHDLFDGDGDGVWKLNSQLAYRWLKGKFMGIPEATHFSQGVLFRAEGDLASAEALEASLSDNTVSVSIFADATDGHTLSCSFVNSRRQIKTLPYSRLLVGLMTAKLEREPCKHDPVPEPAVTRIPWSFIDQCYSVQEIPEAQPVVLTGVEQSRILQVLALGVTVEGTVVQVSQCLRCSLMTSNHVIYAKLT